MSRAIAILLLGLVAVAGCSGGPSESWQVVPLSNPAAPGSAQPDLLAGADGKLYLSWTEPVEPDGHALRFSALVGADWSAPRTVAEGADWFVNWADFPTIAVTARGTMAAHWLRSQPEGGYAYDVWVSTSRDAGENWSSPVRAHDDGTPTEHGFVTLVPRAGGSFRLIWLDGRLMAAENPGAMTLRSAILDANGQIGQAEVLDESVCDCCSTDALISGEKTVVVYRDRTAEEVRDISAVIHDGSRWGGSNPVNDDGWTIAACPVNGPAAAAQEGGLAVAWFTAADEERVLVAFSDDGGQSFSTPARVDDGNPMGRVDLVMLEDGSVVVSWLELENGRAELRLRSVSRAGQEESRTIQALEESRASGFPRMAWFAGQLFLTWTEAGAPSVVRTVQITRR